MIKHIKCDVFESGADVILHQVNCQGVMGSGVAKQVREKYPYVFKEYERLCKTVNHPSELLGRAQLRNIYGYDKEKWIGNLFAQERYGYDGKCYTDYNALKECLLTVATGFSNNTIIAIPYLMGCARGGGDWNVVYKMIEEILEGFDVLICEYDGG